MVLTPMQHVYRQHPPPVIPLTISRLTNQSETNRQRPTMVSNLVQRLALGVLLLAACVHGQDAASPLPSQSPTPTDGQSGGNVTAGGNGTATAADGAPPSEPTGELPDSSKPDQYKPNINMTYWQPAYDPFLGLFPDINFQDNATLWAQRHEWNMTYSHPPLNLSSGDQTALGSVKGTFRANPNRRSWAANSTRPDLTFAIAQEFHFAGTRAILRGKYTNATWGNSSQPAMVIYEMNVDKYDIGPDGLQMPIRVQNMTEPFSDGIIWDSGELAFGCHSFTILMYSGTVELEGLEVHTGFVSD